VNARRSPGRILGNHSENQGADLFADTLPSSYLADSGDPRPIQTKPCSMPVHNGSRSDQDERLGPPRPERSQRNPEQLVQGSQSSARPLRMQSEQLPTESQVLEDEVLPGTESADQPADTIMARIVAEKSEFSFSQVIHSAGVRRFGEAQRSRENGSTKRKGRIERQFSLCPIEGLLKTNVSKLFSRCNFFLLNGILRNSR
jgi:hypothetical protein